MSDNDKIEQNKELVEELEAKLKTCEEAGDFAEAVEICERLVNEFDVYNVRFDLPRLYFKAGDYDKIVEYVNSWMRDENNSFLLDLSPGPIVYLGLAYLNLKSYDLAINNYEFLIRYQTQQMSKFPNTISMRKNFIAEAETELGKVYYVQKNFPEAISHFKAALNSVPYLDAIYYIAHISYLGEGKNKDIDTALEGYLQLSECDLSTQNPNLYTFSDKCIINAIYELGMIYAKEPGYRNKEKAIAYLNKAKNLGYMISDEEIRNLTENIINESEKSASSNKNSSGGCYVATCVYGSYDCPQVWALRRFRDNTLAENVFGRSFIKLYYSISPTVVRLFGDYLWFHKLFKTPLDSFVDKLVEKGVETTPYEDK